MSASGSATPAGTPNADRHQNTGSAGTAGSADSARNGTRAWKRATEGPGSTDDIHTWRRATDADISTLQSLLLPRESWATGFTNRAFGRGGTLARVTRPGAGIYLYGNDQAVLFADSGSSFPLLADRFDDGGPDARQALRGLRAIASTYRPAACTGASDHVLALADAMGWREEIGIAYDAMHIRLAGHERKPAAGDRPERGMVDSRPVADSAHLFAATPSGTGLAAGPAHGSTVPVHGKARCRKATMNDLDALLPLAEAYERAEVMTRLHAFDPAACRAGQARSITRMTVHVVEIDGTIVARAQTNATGLVTDQIGGVYVVPGYRGRGFGRLVMSSLLADIAARGKNASLFVKKTNMAARNLYLSLGFCIVRDYRVSYFR